jgi:hypothetical protein
MTIVWGKVGKEEGNICHRPSPKSSRRYMVTSVGILPCSLCIVNAMAIYESARIKSGWKFDQIAPHGWCAFEPMLR